MSTKVLSHLDFGNTVKVTNLPLPTASTDGASKAYVDSVLEGLAWKDAVHVATTAVINVSGAAPAIDGISPIIGSRILVKNQTTLSQNGIYVVDSSNMLVRADDAQTPAELTQAVVTVMSGTVNGGQTFRQSSTVVAVGTSNIVWTSFGAGTLYATQAEVDAGVITSAVVAPATLAASKYATKGAMSDLVGTASKVIYPVVHNLNSVNVRVEVYNITTGATVLVETARTNANTVTFTFASAFVGTTYRALITANSYTVVV